MLVLVSLLLPTFAGVREATRQVVCSANVRSVGTAMQMYSNVWNDYLPPSVHDGVGRASESRQLHLMFIGRLESMNQWDGAGILYSEGFLSTPGVFYCPSHQGDNRKREFDEQWDGKEGQIALNYHYRGASVNGIERITLLPLTAAVLTDSLGTQQDFNHRVGANALRSDMSVWWVQDQGGKIASSLAPDVGTADNQSRVSTAWRAIDAGVSNGGVVDPSRDPTEAAPEVAPAVQQGRAGRLSR
ncbi:MAG: hypothetical protein C0475_08610 [Planctomyces sp.]|nr:hypothetical protein [Planctomyces sp.]MBA4039121.1 hypothetical protein [Planctomyces sp.]MBA4119916.1 hypothetical protein [Isosphaera sp.]